MFLVQGIFNPFCKIVFCLIIKLYQEADFYFATFAPVSLDASLDAWRASRSGPKKDILTTGNLWSKRLVALMEGFNFFFSFGGRSVSMFCCRCFPDFSLNWTRISLCLGLLRNVGRESC